MLGLCCCAQPLFAVRRGYSWLPSVDLLWWLLSLQSTCSGCAGSGVVARGPWLPHGMWNLPRPGIEPVFLALAGRFLSTGAPGSSPHLVPFIPTYDYLQSACLLFRYCRLHPEPVRGSPHRQGFWSVALMQTCRPLSTHCVWMVSDQEMCSLQSLLSPGTSILMDLGLRRVSS